MPVRSRTQLIKILVIGLLLGSVSCQMPGPGTQQTLSQIANYEVAVKDLPTGWKFTGQTWGQDYGGQSHVVGYGIDDKNQIIRLEHTISIYADEDQAKNAYPKWEEEWFKGAWQKWPGADFVPSDPSDVYRFECQDPGFTEQPIISCNYLQRHKRFISFVLVNFNDKSMTFLQLNAVLKAVDDRLNQIELK